MAYVGAEQWQLEAEEDPEDASKPITDDDVVSNILKFDGTTSRKHEILYETSASESETEESCNKFEEETVELEFEKVKPKLATHDSMHCPNCKSEITKVILRRETRSEQKDLVGCSSCLSLFTISDNGCFNPFDVFQRRPEKSIVHAVRENESCFRMFWNVEKEPKDEDHALPDPVPHVNRQSIITSDQVYNQPLYVNRQSIINFGQVQPPKYDNTNTTSIPKGPFRLISSDIPESSNARGDDNTTIIIENAPETIVVAQSRGRSWLGNEGVLVEILKSIVYGGLMEVIASLSVVSSAAGSNATALCIVSVAVASLIGGVFIIGHNLWDLRDDCYKYTTSQETNESASNKYKELLGQVNYFPLHTFFAILSFLVFGMVPPVTYGYSFHETNDKDFTLVMAATATLLCVLLLSMIQAYINMCTVLEYFKTVVYYIIIAVSMSSVSYVVGNLVARVVEKLGWFNTGSGGDMPCLPRATIPNLEAF